MYWSLIAPCVLESASIPSRTMPAVNNDERSLLIIISARALSSVGFGLSIIAIWLGWLLPIQHVPEPSTTFQVVRNQRRSLPARLLSPPISHVNPILVSRTDNLVIQNRAKHVYFLDSDIPNHPSLHADNATINTNDDPEGNVPSQPIDSSSLDSSPLSSTFTLTTVSPLHTPPLMTNTQDNSEQVTTVHAISRPSSAPPLSNQSSKLARIRQAFKAKRSVVSDDLNTNAAWNVAPTTDSHTRRRSLPWSISRHQMSPTNSLSRSDSEKSTSSHRLSFTRCRTGLASSQHSSSDSFPLSPSPCSTPMSNSFFKKAQRRTSAPVPRTSPYEAPYFASPPLLLDDFNCPPYLRRVPHDEDHGSSQEPEGEYLDMQEFGYRPKFQHKFASDGHVTCPNTFS